MEIVKWKMYHYRSDHGYSWIHVQKKKSNCKWDYHQSHLTICHLKNQWNPMRSNYDTEKI